MTKARGLTMDERRLAEEERKRIEELLRAANRGTYRAIALEVGRSVFSVCEIASALIDAGEIPTPKIGRTKGK